MAAKPKGAPRWADVSQRDNPIRSSDGDSISLRTERNAVHERAFVKRYDVGRRGRIFNAVHATDKMPPLPVDQRVISHVVEPPSGGAGGGSVAHTQRRIGSRQIRQIGLPSGFGRSSASVGGVQLRFACHLLSVITLPADFLFRSGEDAVQEAVRKCWASAFSERIKSYEKAHDQKNLPEMAVLIQSMVAADVAGVAFTANPTTGVRNEVVINAVHGLGERLVSGEVTPEQWVINKNEVITKNGETPPCPPLKRGSIERSTGARDS